MIKKWQRSADFQSANKSLRSYQMNTEKSLKKLRLFAASPSDVATERSKLETVVGLLKPLADHIGLSVEVVDWRKVVPDMGRPQQVIFDQL